MKPKWKPSGALYWLLLQVIVLACLAFTLLGFAGAWHWYLDLFSHFRPQYVLSLAVASLVLLLRRKWFAGALGMLGLAINVSVLLPHASQSLPVHPPSAATPPIRCVSLNLLQGNENYDKVEQFLRGIAADVLVFQEVSPKWGAVLQRLKDVYPEQLIRARKDSKGMALLTKHPVQNLRFEPVPGQEQIGAMIAEVQTPAGPFAMFGIHSHKPTSAEGFVSQRTYFHWLVAQNSKAAAGGLPVVIMGDFNATPWCAALRTFVSESQLLDTSRGRTFDASWNRWLPHRLLIDHAFISPAWRMINREIGPAVGSDHRPLILDLMLTPRTPAP